MTVFLGDGSHEIIYVEYLFPDRFDHDSTGFLSLLKIASGLAWAGIWGRLRRMLNILRLLGALLWSRCKSRAGRDAEILFLRQQLIVLRRAAPRRICLRWTDRLIFVCLWRLFPSLRRSAVIFQPETLIRWHRSGFRLFWRRKSRGRAGRPPIPADVRSLVRRMNQENSLWGAPRIHGELLKLGIIIAQSTVAKYMRRRQYPPSQGW